jgi:hypothetical protein
MLLDLQRLDSKLWRLRLFEDSFKGRRLVGIRPPRPSKTGTTRIDEFISTIITSSREWIDNVLDARNTFVSYRSYDDYMSLLFRWSFWLFGRALWWEFVRWTFWRISIWFSRLIREFVSRMRVTFSWTWAFRRWQTSLTKCTRLNLLLFGNVSTLIMSVSLSRTWVGSHIDDQCNRIDVSDWSISLVYDQHLHNTSREHHCTIGRSLSFVTCAYIYTYRTKQNKTILKFLPFGNSTNSSQLWLILRSTTCFIAWIVTFRCRTNTNEIKNKQKKIKWKANVLIQSNTIPLVCRDDLHTKHEKNCDNGYVHWCN